MARAFHQSSLLPKEFAFDSVQLTVVYGRLGPGAEGNLFMVNPQVDQFNYAVNAGSGGYFVLEIEPGYYRISKYQFNAVKKGSWHGRGHFEPDPKPPDPDLLQPDGTSIPQGRTEIQEYQGEEDNQVVGLNFIGKTGEILYLGTFFKSGEFLESRDEKDSADAWMARTYPAFKQDRTKKYLAK